MNISTWFLSILCSIFVCLFRPHSYRLDITILNAKINPDTKLFLHTVKISSNFTLYVYIKDARVMLLLTNVDYIFINIKRKISSVGQTYDRLLLTEVDDVLLRND